MNKNFAIFAHGLLCVSLVIAGNDFKLVTWNVLGINVQDRRDFFNDAQNANRPDSILTELDQINADVVCLQEVTQAEVGKNGIFDLGKKSIKYQLASFVSKGANGGCALFFNNQKFKLLEFANIEMKDANLGGGSAACALLETLANQQRCLICSVHLSRGNERTHNNPAKGQFQIQNLMDQLDGALRAKRANWKNYPLILAGDFNTLYEEVMNVYCSQFNFDMFQHELLTVCKPNNTFGSIDHILYRPAGFLKIQDSLHLRNLGYVDSSVVNNRQFVSCNTCSLISSTVPSDHLPLQAMFSFDYRLQQVAKVLPVVTPKAIVVPVPKNVPVSPKAPVQRLNVDDTLDRFLNHYLMQSAFDREIENLVNRGILFFDQMLQQGFAMISPEVKNIFYQALQQGHPVARQIHQILVDKIDAEIQRQQAKQVQPAPVANASNALMRAVKIAKVLNS